MQFEFEADSKCGDPQKRSSLWTGKITHPDLFSLRVRRYDAAKGQNQNISKYFQTPLGYSGFEP